MAPEGPFCLNRTRVKEKFENACCMGKGTHYQFYLKAHCRCADWINKTIKKKRIRQGSVISLHSEIHEDDNDLIPFILETKYDPRALRLGNYSKARTCFRFQHLN